MHETDTVRNRIERTRVDYSPTQLLAGSAFLAAIAFTLVFLQEPLVHDAMHNFRHAVGITCH